MKTSQLQESQSHKRLSYGSKSAIPKFSIKLENTERADEDATNLKSPAPCTEKIDQDGTKAEQGETLPAMPILPKSTFEFRLPPRCPLEHISFIQLRKLIPCPEKKEQMGFGFDFIDMKFKDRKAAILAKEGKSPYDLPDSKKPGFSMGIPPSEKKEPVVVD